MERMGSAKRLKMTIHKLKEVVPTGEEIGLKLLQSAGNQGQTTVSALTKKMP